MVLQVSYDRTEEKLPRFAWTTEAIGVAKRIEWFEPLIDEYDREGVNMQTTVPGNMIV